MGVYTWSGSGTSVFELKNPQRLEKELRVMFDVIPAEGEGWEFLDDARFEAALLFGAKNFKYPDKWVAHLEREIKSAAADERRATLKSRKRFSLEHRKLDKAIRASMSRKTRAEIVRLKIILRKELDKQEDKLRQLSQLRVKCRELETYVDLIREVVKKQKK